jgi:hypothetical protein
MRKFLAFCAAAFRQGFEQARAEARAQPALIALGNPFACLNETEVKASIAAAIRGAFDEGVAAERKRIGEILQAPGAATFREIAMDLVLGPASSAQAAGVLARAEADAATRAGAIKSNILDRASSQVTLH